MKFETLTSELVVVVEPWFDNEETIRHLGGREWVRRAFVLAREAPGVEFRGRIVLARHVWIVFDRSDQPVALIDVEPYDDGTAGIAFVVAPYLRNQGIGQQVLLALTKHELLQDIHTIIGGVEPENMACRVCLAKAGFFIAEEPDEEDMLRAEKKLR